MEVRLKSRADDFRAQDFIFSPLYKDKIVIKCMPPDYTAFGYNL